MTASRVTYLSFKTVVALNERHCGDGAGVRDEAGIRAALGRAEATFMGEDLAPTIWEKAAVMLHGLSSTQCFLDGNKRTAWMATTLFLRANGHALRPISDIEAEALVLTVATGAFDSDEHPDRAIQKTVEWLRTVRRVMADRLDYAILALEADMQRDRGPLFDASSAQIGSFALSSFPTAIDIAAIVRTKFFADDAYRDWTLRAHIVSDDKCVELVGPSPVAMEYVTAHGVLPDWFDNARDTVPYSEQTALAFEDLGAQHESGMMPSIIVLPLILKIRSAGRAHVIFTINGEFLARRLLTILRAPDLAVDANVDETIARLLSQG